VLAPVAFLASVRFETAQPRFFSSAISAGTAVNRSATRP